MMKKIFIFILFIIILLPRCFREKVIDNTHKFAEIEDGFGRRVILEKEPAKIISLAPGITEIIFALNAGDKLIGRTEYCDYPSEALAVESIGTLTNPNIEKIASLKPDLVIAATHFKEDVLDKLEELEIKTVILINQESFDGVYNVIKKCGVLLNRKKEAKDLVDEMEIEIEEICNKVKGKKPPLVYYVVDYGEFGDYTAGRGTFISAMIKMAGGENAADDVEGWKYNLEKLIDKDPDILICSKYLDMKQGIMEAHGYKYLTAVKEGRVFEIDNNCLDRQGPRLVVGFEELAKIIHPELFF